MDLLGHTSQRARLSELVARDRLPSANLFVGQSGIGKSLVVQEIATKLLCSDGGCANCATCQSIAKRSCPDFIVADCAADSGGSVEALREVLQKLALRPFGGRARVVLLDHAEALSLQGANILLKHLEEPRPGTYFFLVTSSPSTLPATLRSRAQPWHFDALSAADFCAIISSLGQTERLPQNWRGRAKLEQLCALSDGSPGAFIELSEHLATWESLEETLVRAEARDPIPGFLVAQELHKAKEKLPVVLSFLRSYGRRRLHSSDEPQRWATFLGNLCDAEYLILERNCSPLLVLHFLMLTLANPPGFLSLAATVEAPNLLQHWMV